MLRSEHRELVVGVGGQTPIPLLLQMLAGALQAVNCHFGLGLPVVSTGQYNG